jgi:hypothetical protein
MEKNGLNKEIRRLQRIWPPAVNLRLTIIIAPRRAQAADTTTFSPSGASVTVSPQACANSRV